MNKKDPLRNLITDKSINRQELADALNPFIIFTTEGGIDFLPNFVSLVNEKKILICLLATKAQNLLFGKGKDRSKPSEISRISSMPIGSVKPTLTKLLSEKKISKDGGYFIPNFLISATHKNLIEKK